MTPRPPTWKILSAFAIIYFVWGSTYLAIRVGVLEMPPFLMAGIRFFLAGAILYGWMRLTGVPSPTRREWRDAIILGAFMFLMDYACLFWAEQRVPSGISAVILAAIPVCITLLEILFLRTQKLTLRLAAGLGVGILGVGVLVNPFSSLGEAPLDHGGVIALIVACWLVWRWRHISRKACSRCTASRSRWPATADLCAGSWRSRPSAWVRRYPPRRGGLSLSRGTALVLSRLRA